MNVQTLIIICTISQLQNGIQDKIAGTQKNANYLLYKARQIAGVFGEFG